MLLTVNDHAMQLERAIGECRKEYEILIDAIINSQKGVIQPHIINTCPDYSQADIPNELTLQILLSAAYHNLVLRILEFDVFLKGNYLVCDSPDFD
jgi:hypothetical protein